MRSRAAARDPSAQASPSSMLTTPNKPRRRSISNNRMMPAIASVGVILTVVYLLFFVSQFQSAANIQNIQKPSSTLGECQYDGHCPLRSVCASSGTGSGGICQTIAPAGRHVAIYRNPCTEMCLKELQMDEHFYQESWPVLEWAEATPPTRERPAGCSLVYRREPEGEKWNALQKTDSETKWREIPPSIKAWADSRFRSVVRVDPLSDDPQDNNWVAYCHGSCQTNVDCATASDELIPSFTCQQSVCQRNPDYWDREKDETKPEMVIVSAATNGYIQGLTNLAASLRYWAPHHKMVIYNLGGMTAAHIRKIESWSNVLSVEWRDGVPKQYPPHISHGKVYAWKPIIVNETLHKYKSIFWLDAGSTVVGPISPVEEVIQRTGMLLVKGQDSDMKPKSHKSTYQWFNTTKDTFVAGPHYSGNTQAFLYPSRYVDSIVVPDTICALDVTCIAPKGSALSNHRYDQTTISILAYMPKVRAPHYTEYLAASKSQLNLNLRKASFKFIWTARQGTKFYTNLEHNP